MRIGIDIDDTITNTKELIRKYKIKEFPKLKENDLIPINCINDFYNKYVKIIHKTVTLKENAKEVIKELKKLNHEIFIITLRENTKEEKEITTNYLKENEILYDDIYFEVEDKGKLAKKLHLDLVIDDRLEMCKKIKNKHIDVLKMHRDDEENEGIKEVYNWNEILEYIRRIS